MYRLVIALLVPLVAVLTPPAARAEEPTPPPLVTQVDTSRYPEVTVYVRVTDSAGQPLVGLSARDFTLTEDGRPAMITGFVGGGASAVTTALVVDRSGSMADAGKLRGATDAAAAFVDLMRPGDRSALVAFSSSPETVIDFTGDRALLRDALRRLRPEGGTALYDSVAAGVEALRGAGGRRALLVLTDGQDCRDDPLCPDEAGSTRGVDEAISAARDAGQPVHVVGLGERGGGGGGGVDEDVLRRIARETGGEYFYAPDAARLAELYRRLAQGIQQEYALTYRSPRPFYDGTRRDIAVSVHGAAPAGAGYLQPHLVNIRSSPVIGFLLLVPLAWALVLPRLIGTLRVGRGGVAEPGRVLPATGATLVEPPARRSFCVECGAPLRGGARFCGACGAPAASEVTA